METKIKARSFMRGPQGKAFTYEDFTPEQLAALKGKGGADGFSPTVEISTIDGGYRITITDATDSKSVDVMDGKDGKNGQDGSDGKDGSNGATFIPKVDAEGNLSWTNDRGLDNPDIVNIRGSDGKDGVDGKDGEDGKTPVKGTDYFTETERKEMVNEIMAALNDLDEVSY